MIHPRPIAAKVPLCGGGGTIPGPAKMQFSWVVVPGWFPRMPTAARAPRKLCFRGWFWRGVAVARPSGGGKTITTPSPRRRQSFPLRRGGGCAAGVVPQNTPRPIAAKVPLCGGVAAVPPGWSPQNTHRRLCPAQR